MCCSAAPAKFTGTRILLHQMTLEEVGTVRVLMYQNNVFSIGGEANCMLLHIPTNDYVGEENFIDMSEARHVMMDMEVALRPPISRSAFSLGTPIGSAKSPAQVFDVGEYTMVVADDPLDIFNALSRVPAGKRPNVSEELLGFYTSNFPIGFKFVLACFNNPKTSRPAPIAVYYKPRPEDEFRFVFPGIDSHTGGAPDMNSLVELDHWIFASIEGMSRGKSVRYGSSVPSQVRKFLPETIVGKQYDGMAQNGDFSFEIKQIFSGHLTFMSRLKPEAY